MNLKIAITLNIDIKSEENYHNRVKILSKITMANFKRLITTTEMK